MLDRIQATASRRRTSRRVRARPSRITKVSDGYFETWGLRSCAAVLLSSGMPKHPSRCRHRESDFAKLIAPQGDAIGKVLISGGRDVSSPSLASKADTHQMGMDDGYATGAFYAIA